jgi:hypothetical protein
MKASELPDYLRERFGPNRLNRACAAAANGMALRYDIVVKYTTLTRMTGHPSAPGEPPALESGRLRDTFRLQRAKPIGDFRWMASDGPTVVYAHIQEYGGEIWARHTYVDKRTGITRPGFLRWKGEDGEFHYARHVKLPERPYVRPTIKQVTNDGSLRRAAVQGFSRELYAH